MGLLLLALVARAHSPDALTVRLVTGDRGAVVEVVAQTAGVEAAFARRFPGGLVPLDSPEGKQRFVGVIKECVKLATRGGDVELGAGALKVDAFETKLRLSARLPGGELLPLAVHLPCLTENPGQRNTFHLLRGREDTRVLLTAERSFFALLELEDDRVVVRD